MASQHFRCIVNAPFDRLWQTLMEEVEHPERFNHGILNCKIIERFNNGVLRSVSVPDAEVRERVTYRYEQGSIASQLVGHPDLVGVIEKRLSPLPDQAESWVLESAIEWESISPRVDHMIRRNIEKFVTLSLENVKKSAESAI